MTMLVNSLQLYPEWSFKFSTKEAKNEKDASAKARFFRMREIYLREGMRTTVEGILLVYRSEEPHILLMEIGDNFWKLPGGRLRAGENEIEGLKRKLKSKLGPNSDLQADWQIGDCLAVWWRPYFSKEMFPFCTPYTTRPKECRKLFLVHLSPGMHIATPRNCKLIVEPISELHNNVQKYGPRLSSIPALLSRFQFIPPETEH